MYFEFDWDDANTHHLALHNVRPEEAEQTLDDPHALSIPAYEVDREMRFGLLGATDVDRVLVVIYTWRRARVRVVTAFPATVRQQRMYRMYMERSV